MDDGNIAKDEFLPGARSGSKSDRLAGSLGPWLLTLEIKDITGTKIILGF